MKKLHSNGSASWPWFALAVTLLVSVRPAMAGTNTVTNVNDSGPGSLRQAMLDANTAAPPAVIHFNIPPGGAQTIAPLSPLPDLTNSVTLDATTQPGFAGSPIIELNGASAGSSANGLTVTYDAIDAVIRGFVINRFSGHGVYLTPYHGIVLEGNYIGTDRTGTVALGNHGDGVYVWGGVLPSSRVGGTNLAARNVISGNLGYGVSATLCNLLGNFIGTDASGQNPLGNGTGGVFVRPLAVVGNGTPEGGNRIAYNGGSGIGFGMNFPNGSSFIGNSIYANAGLGIDLGTNGVTLNDVGDGDVGPNGRQNFPVLTAATNSGVNLVAFGTLNSGTNLSYRIDFYANTECDPSGYGEGKTHLGFTNVTTGANASASFRAVLPPSGEPYLTAIATDGNGKSSEFSLCRVVVQPRTNTVTNLNDNGPGSLRDAIATALPGDVITFATNGTITLTSDGLVIDKNLTIAGPGAANLAISGYGGFRIDDSEVTANISGLAFRDGSRAIYNAGTLTVRACVISGNTAIGNSGGGAGGGIFNEGTLTLTTCSISGNIARFEFIGGSGSANRGGGICNLGTLTATACTISGNTVAPDSWNFAYGGGIYNAGTLSATACTISDNTGFAIPPFHSAGGGIYNMGTLMLTACTVSGNLSGGGGGIYGSCTLRNTLVAVNNSRDIDGSVTSLGHNLIGVTDGSTGITNGVNGDLVGTSASRLDPKLGGLRDNGGPTPTLSLSSDSPAIDAGDDGLLSAPFNLTTDQRGFLREAGAHVDIGAFERHPGDFQLLPGDFNHDGMVSLEELNVVQASYFSTSPWLALTNVAGLGGAQVTFALTNSLAGAFSVEFSTDLVNWQLLGPATPRYEFTDTNAPAVPQRYYRLRWP